jgi:DNA-binding response OmpR family regulator
MAKVVLIGLEQSAASQIGKALSTESHEIDNKPCTAPVSDILNADIVFAAGDSKQYLPLLKGVRKARPSLPFVVVTRIPETSDWLDALEAGATDYCSAPFEARQIRWLMESALPRPRTCAA